MDKVREIEKQMQEVFDKFEALAGNSKKSYYQKVLMYEFYRDKYNELNDERNRLLSVQN